MVIKQTSQVLILLEIVRFKPSTWTACLIDSSPNSKVDILPTPTGTDPLLKRSNFIFRLNLKRKIFPRVDLFSCVKSIRMFLHPILMMSREILTSKVLIPKSHVNLVTVLPATEEHAIFRKGLMSMISLQIVKTLLSIIPKWIKPKRESHHIAWVKLNNSRFGTKKSKRARRHLGPIVTIRISVLSR